ncbi:hypothetical protein N7468_007277 [Penicillium chermesinum]|uniref:SNF2 family helicase/ATPase n=1 Tax=Penicillium chermesinum TaxID=63820 RepID=A0A9W9TKC9_9EURO|nr:uncharacterized protein N7468_007277 [Penicillium chermesinum]KAJ5226052.1 hypothetical protein N7468_007277 [Penicillium chermesinum]
MARESSAPNETVSQERSSATPRKTGTNGPEFGKPSPIGQQQWRPKPGSNHPFNIPKSNQARPEHHRPANRPQQTAQPYHGHLSGAVQAPRAPSAHTGPSQTTQAKRSEPFDPFKPVRPSAYNDTRTAIAPGATPIKRPENVTWSTPRAPRALFSSKPAAAKPSVLQSFVDLTRDASDTSIQSGRSVGQRSEFGTGDIYGYIDSEKANENIKALLEGAFEDEEEEKPRPKAKGKNKNKKKKSQKQQKAEKAESAVKAKKDDDIDDLAAQLGGVTVDDKISDSEAKEPQKKLKKPSGEKEDALSHDEAEAEEEELEEDDEEGEEEDDEEDDAIVEGLKVTLLPHQVEGVRWMCDKETGRRTTKGIFPKGGILADDMGLGKTVQAISLLLRNRKSHNEHSDKSDDASVRSSKSTLVVAPLALIKQWEAEISDKVEKSHKLSVCVYHGTNRAKTSKSLDDYDVVITTYGTLTSESGTAAADKAKKTGIFSVHWYRIILDEAHTIKNRNAKATQAAYALDAQYRWCLTGTPMQNNLDELQSLIKFLRIKPYDDLAAWRDQITRPLANNRGNLAIQRLQVYLKAFMKRRTKDVLKSNETKLDGPDGEEKSSNGFQIVKREVIRVDADFMDGERKFYQRLERRTENRLEEMMGGDKVDYAGALVLLLRLRQACNHPDLVKSDLAGDKADVLLQNGNGRNEASKTEQKDLDDVADLFGALSVLTKKCDELSPGETKDGATLCTDCETDLNTNFMTREKKKKHKSKKPRSNRKEAEVKASQATAPRPHRNRRVVLDSDDEDEAEWIVPEAQRPAPNLGKAGGSDDEDAEGGGDWIGSEDSDTDDDQIDSPSRKKSKPIILDDSEDETDSETEEDSDEDNIYENPTVGEKGELPSTKIRHLMEILRKEAPDYKFIVFSVFTSMLDKIEPFLRRANIGFARYDGQMRNDHREASLNKLRNHTGTRVLLCSLRAGALGLNLTAASRVVILEPFWNPFVEEQAIDRVHRLNQTVDVKIYRMVIKSTVEERIVALQDRKRELANATIEGKSAAGKLNMRDMMALFGRDAESRYNDGDQQTSLDFNKPTRLLNAAEELISSTSSLYSGYSDYRARDRKNPSHRSTPDDSVYGRRW